MSKVQLAFSVSENLFVEKVYEAELGPENECSYRRYMSCNKALSNLRCQGRCWFFVYKWGIGSVWCKNEVVSLTLSISCRFALDISHILCSWLMRLRIEQHHLGTHAFYARLATHIDYVVWVRFNAGSIPPSLVVLYRHVSFWNERYVNVLHSVASVAACCNDDVGWGGNEA